MPPLCYIDPLQQNDLGALAVLFSDARAYLFLGGPSDLNTAKKKAARWISSDPHTWAIRRKSDSRFLGFVTLSDHHDGIDTEISYALLPEHWGQGYATKALHDAIRYAFETLELTKLIAETQKKNRKSIQLLERIGMVFEREVVRFGEHQAIYTLINKNANRD